MESVEISLTKSVFEEKKKGFLQAWKNENPNEEVSYDTYRITPRLDIDTCEFKDDTIIFDAAMMSGNEHVGYVQIKLPVTIDLAADIIDAQVKKYNKIKTILEATK